jgi:thioredoxin reductase (NADPH)
MDMGARMHDIIIVGGGPAGLSAAITARQRGKSVAVISNDASESGLYKTGSVRNYPGFADISGAALLDKLYRHAADMGAEHIRSRVSSVLPAGDSVGVSHAADVSMARAAILAIGLERPSVFQGELELLGRGVSYCATCDGRFFKGKRVCAVMRAGDAEGEAKYLESIGCEVVRLTSRDIAINGGAAVESVTADGLDIPCAGVFIFRHTVAPASLLPGIEMFDGHIKADGAMRTNMPGVFAAGDCAGAPYQIAKAAGQGQVAALSAAGYVESGGKQ